MTPVDRIRVGVLGAQGRMGSLVCDSVRTDDEMDLVAELDSGDDLSRLADADVVVDFTIPDVAPTHVQWCIEHGRSIVVGTSGFSEAQIEQVRRTPGVDDVAVIIVPNFAIGAVLMMRWAAEAARFFGDAEVFEYHHPRKLDAPSGTAVHTAEIIGEARRAAGIAGVDQSDVTQIQAARGHLVDGVPVHSARGAGFLAHQDVVFGAPGERLTIRHDSLDRAAFMPGVLLAVRAAMVRRGVTIGLEPLLTL